jgi:hypothetical protein
MVPHATTLRGLCKVFFSGKSSCGASEREGSEALDRPIRAADEAYRHTADRAPVHLGMRVHPGSGPGCNFHQRDRQRGGTQSP